MKEGQTVKVKDAMQSGRKSSFQKYRELTYGDRPFGYVLAAEWILAVSGSCPGGLGLWLRSKLYPFLFKETGRKVFFGRHITVRHPHKIRLGDNVVIDDNCVLDAKGTTNAGIVIEDNVYIGRNTIVYCKNGDIRIETGANLSSNCEIFSSNRLTLGAGTVVGAYSYLLSGGEYDYEDETPFCKQSGMETKGPLTIGPNCWLGARVTVLDAANIGERCVIGAGAVVTKPIPPDSVAVGIPAKVVKTLAAEGSKVERSKVEGR